MTAYRILFETTWGTAAIDTDENFNPARIHLPPVGSLPTAGRILNATDADKTLRKWIEFLQSYFDRHFIRPPRIDHFFPSGFSLMIYRQLQKIPAGKTTTYKELAASAGRPTAYRAAANALAKNPFPIVIPCHRVLRSDGSLGGFSAPGGLEYKRKLLEHEGVKL